LIEEAKKIALRSSQYRYQTGCVLVKNGELISNGWSHKAHYKPNGLLSLHAELHAIARGRHCDLNGSVAFVANISRKSGNIALARPCLRCAIALRGVGVRAVAYTTSDGIKWINPEDELKDLKTYDAPENLVNPRDRL
jgi:deoxycytidylate deaminase